MCSEYMASPVTLSLIMTPQITAQFCCLHDITVSLSSGFHPQTNAETERLNQQLETGLCFLCNWDPSSWAKNVAWVEYTHNSLQSSATGITPFEIYPSKDTNPPCFILKLTEVTVPSATMVRRCHRA